MASPDSGSGWTGSCRWGGFRGAVAPRNGSAHQRNGPDFAVCLAWPSRQL